MRIQRPHVTPIPHRCRTPSAVSLQNGVAGALPGVSSVGRGRGEIISANAAKVTIDAYDGSVNFYLMEQEQDPVAECYRRIFPDLFKPFDAMPEDLKTHIRYPTTMFLIQARMYQDYHMKHPITFYASEDQWQIGEELYDNTERPRPAQPLQPQSPFARTQQLPDTVTNVQEVAPYYVVVKIPGEERAEFVLMLPFTPKNQAEPHCMDCCEMRFSTVWTTVWSIASKRQTRPRTDADGKLHHTRAWDFPAD